MSGGAQQFRILIVAAEPGHAESVLRRLHAARLPVQGLFTQQPDTVRTLLDEHPSDLLLVRLGGGITAAAVAAHCRAADIRMPMLILDQNAGDRAEPVDRADRADLIDLVDLMSSGVDGLIRDIDDERLVLLVRRRIEQVDADRRRATLDEQANRYRLCVQGLLDHCPSPVALLSDGVISLANPAMMALLGLAPTAHPGGRRLSDLAAPEQAAELEQRLQSASLSAKQSPTGPRARARAHDAEQRGPTSATFVHEGGRQVQARLRLHPIELPDGPGLAVFLQPADGREPAHPHQPIDAETGLPDRGALLERLARQLANDASPERRVFLLYARMGDFGVVCRGYGLTRGLEHAADIASRIRAAAPDEAFTARVADDACVILTQDTETLSTETLGERLLARLAAVAPNAAMPALELGIASARPGESDASTLLDQAFANCLTNAAAQMQTDPQAAQRLESPLPTPSSRPHSAGLPDLVTQAIETDSAEPSERGSILARSERRPGGHAAAASGAAGFELELKLGPEFIPEAGRRAAPARGAWFGPQIDPGSARAADPSDNAGVVADAHTSVDPIADPIDTPAAYPSAHPGTDPESESLSLTLHSIAHDPSAPTDHGLDAGMLDDSVTACIERALETDGFTVMYQPIISLMGDSQEHYSVLVRLRGEHDRLLTARELLGPAARAGSLPDVDRWVMQRAFQEQARRRRLGQKVSLFLSLSKEIVQDERLLISICDALREFEIHGSWITFQFQQSEALALGDKWTLLADGLKKIQSRICVNEVGLMDDTERGMETMQADFIKFAPELAMGFATDQRIQKRLLQLINVAQQRGVKTIVTGVEDARSLALLWSTGIDYVQGNFLHGALPRLDAPR